MLQGKLYATNTDETQTRDCDWLVEVDTHQIKIDVTTTNNLIESYISDLDEEQSR